MATSVVVAVCTMDRPVELRRCLAALADGGATTVLVVDAGGYDAAAEICDSAPSPLAVHRQRTVPGLAAQRNLAIEWARQEGAEILIFVDDDVVVRAGFMTELMQALEGSGIAAAGATVVDEPVVRLVGLKSFFQLWSRRPGAVLASGRNVIGHGPNGTFPRDVSWLSTCAVGLRLDLLGDLRFDERLAGYSYGEDLDLTWRLGKRHRLVVSGSPRVEHRASSQHRPDPADLARRRTVLLHAWVTEHRRDGLSLPLFWWSVLGELALGLLGAVSGRGGALAQARGTAKGAWLVLRRGSSRSQI